MESLEHRIPPPVVVIVLGLAMWGMAQVLPAMSIDNTVRYAIASAFFCLGLMFGSPAVLAFVRARTTVDPVHIESASALVTTGIYRYSRNPMYAGLAAVLASWAVYLAVPWTFLGPVAFVLFMTRFQIIPEERVMREKFGSAYTEYQSKVRRWL
jgi:protein-S-isoprenylcysteine O-methyltransferase Ste14